MTMKRFLSTARLRLKLLPLNLREALRGERGAFVSGKDAVFKIDDSAGTLRDLSAFLENVDYSDELAALITTTFGKNTATRIPGLRDGRISITGNFDSIATTGPHDALKAHPAGTRTFEFGPEGSGVGKPRVTGECIRTTYRVNSSVDGKVTFTAEFEISDAVTFNTF